MSQAAANRAARAVSLVVNPAVSRAAATVPRARAAANPVAVAAPAVPGPATAPAAVLATGTITLAATPISRPRAARKPESP